MADWEYLELRLIQNIKDGYWYWSDTKLSTNANERLDAMGAKGWELISTYTVIKTVENNIFTSRISYIFKRPLE